MITVSEMNNIFIQNILHLTDSDQDTVCIELQYNLVIIVMHDITNMYALLIFGYTIQTLTL